MAAALSEAIERTPDEADLLADNRVTSLRFAPGQPLALGGVAADGGEGVLRLAVTLEPPIVEELLTGNQREMGAYSEVVLPWRNPDSAAIDHFLQQAQYKASFPLELQSRCTFRH